MKGTLPDLNDLLNVIFRIRFGADDQDTVEEVYGETMRTPHVGASYPRHATIGGHDDQRRQFAFQCPVQEREALNVEHVDFVDEQHLQAVRRSIVTRKGKRRTPGMISALPSSRHSATLVFIWSRSSGLISPVSPAKRARKPCVLLLMTSISWSETVWTTSLRFCISPSGHCTNFVCENELV